MDGTYYDHTGLPPSQNSSVINDGRKGSLYLYPYYPQINTEARNHILCDVLLIVNQHGNSGQYRWFIIFVTVWFRSGKG